jgi:modulator of FtsH protease
VSAYAPAAWSDFSLAQLGASAALLGLVFVGFSINLREFVGEGQLVNRALEAVVSLGAVLVASTAVLVPGQSRDALAVEMLLVAAGTAVVLARLQQGAAAAVRAPGSPSPRSTVVFRRLVGFGATALLALAGATLLAGAGGGLYWWPAAVVIAYFGALTDAWVLIVEILR